MIGPKVVTQKKKKIEMGPKPNGNGDAQKKEGAILGKGRERTKKRSPNHTLVKEESRIPNYLLHPGK